MARQNPPRAETIAKDAKNRSRLNTDLDLYRRFYSMIEEDPENESRILIQFVAPKIIAYEDYRFYLLQNSVRRQLSIDRYYRPDYVSYDEYGTTNLWALLLFINDIPTIEDFVVEDILIPSRGAIANISRDNLLRNLITEVVPLYDLPAKKTPPLFTGVSGLPDYKAPDTTTPKFAPADMYFNRELFTVTNVIARQRYVELKFAAVAESIELNIRNEPNYLYGKHFVLIKGSSGNNRVTWDPRLLAGGIGLVDVMDEDVDFEVKYARVVTT